ncbi:MULTISPECIES: hypothetical protein [unclassified Haladaptatus]|uniref:hypothetical protein n=1 Tax=unclassified Haladaptatus TaxID=2622732 RepID=UPI0023E8C7CC|nr:MULTISPECIES: hypothetical protein [unclassified Haladaptatus]
MDFRVFGVALLVVLAGCGGLGGTEEDGHPGPDVFADVYVANEDSKPYTVDILILHNGSIEHWSTQHIAASNESVTHGALIRPDGISNTTRDYSILIRLNNSSEGVRYETEPYARECYGIGADIVDGELTGPIIMHHQERYCTFPNDTTSSA